MRSLDRMQMFTVFRNSQARNAFLTRNPFDEQFCFKFRRFADLMVHGMHELPMAQPREYEKALAFGLNGNQSTLLFNKNVSRIHREGYIWKIEIKLSCISCHYKHLTIVYTLEILSLTFTHS